jgi:hypothetical protein
MPIAEGTIKATVPVFYTFDNNSAVFISFTFNLFITSVKIIVI